MQANAPRYPPAIPSSLDPELHFRRGAPADIVIHPRLRFLLDRDIIIAPPDIGNIHAILVGPLKRVLVLIGNRHRSRLLDGEVPLMGTRHLVDYATALVVKAVPNVGQALIEAATSGG